MKINIEVEISTSLNKEDAIEELVKMLDLDNLKGEELNSTKIEEVTVKEREWWK